MKRVLILCGFCMAASGMLWAEEKPAPAPAPAPAVAAPAPVAPAPAPVPAPALAKPAVAPAASTSAKPSVEFYGYVKLDAAYDSAETDSGNCPTYVISKTARRGSESDFSVTARESRFGLNLVGPDLGSTKTGGKIEGDFYASGSPEDAAFFRMRHAYLEVTWPQHDFAILAGQTADLIGILVPPTINYQVLRRGGNIDYRHPQLRLTKGIAFGNAKVIAQVAAVRTVLAAGTAETADTGYGNDASFPTLQGRLALSVPLLTSKPTVIGLFGHYGREEIHSRTVDKDFNSWSGGLDLTVPVTDLVALTGEVWDGSNMDAYNGGIGQGYNATLLKEIPAMGAWLAVAMGPVKACKFNVGGGFDQPDAAKLNANDRELNMVFFGNAWHSINDAVKVGIEPSYMITAYKGQKYTSAIRLQGAMMYTF